MMTSRNDRFPATPRRGRASQGAYWLRHSVRPDSDREHRRPRRRVAFIRTESPIDSAGGWLDRHPVAWVCALAVLCGVVGAALLLMPAILDSIRAGAM